MSTHEKLGELVATSATIYELSDGGTAHFKPDYYMSFHNDRDVVGTLNFNGPEMVFTGDAEASAKVFIDWIADSFSGRLAVERERCAKLCDDADNSTPPADLADAIRRLA